MPTDEPVLPLHGTKVSLKDTFMENSYSCFPSEKVLGTKFYWLLIRRNFTSRSVYHMIESSFS